MSKKDLVAKQNPLSLVNQLVSKWKPYGAKISLNEFWETRDPKTLRSIWHSKVGIADLKKVGVGSDTVKSQAKFLATQRFLQQLLPEDMTWNQAVLLIGDKNRVDELNAILAKAVAIE